MRSVTVYSTEACQTCAQVKSLLDAREIPYEEVVIARDSTQHKELGERTGLMTLPQVFIGRILLGGGRETMAAASNGLLDDMLVD